MAKSGFLSDNDIVTDKILFASINLETGKFEHEGKLYPAIRGQLMGLDTHILDFKSNPQKKLDVYIFDIDTLSTIKVQIGYYSWLCFSLLNSLVNIPNNQNSGILQISASKQNDNYQLFTRWNDIPLKWKYNYDDLKLKELNGKEKTDKRNQIIDEWYSQLYKSIPYHKNEPEVSVEPESVNTKDDDIPF